MAFRGTFDHTLDAKNRLTIPAKFRASLADGVVLAKGIERCVQVWTPTAYDSYVETALAGMNPLSEPARKLGRFFAANALDSELDAAGRGMVPGFLLDPGGGGKGGVVAGAGDGPEGGGRAPRAGRNEGPSRDLPPTPAALCP